ncbi:uncharacterized protein NDAI_0H02180 [Naumovozyma dairenensis CBS 421]|uniref:Aminotransferase class I/classII large domain-containing protein n=1 Tax=Naumovozyma dairenensis (strain ATCC 10597 / BCRC 20456 / CBS 421 / NBRC 0211 / NRRL Y-12639) TaxID=1071378 RepID=G0WF31_NAUDC|nr:hypothetical protein NDAI_0H02180 [Naumovozyma dairenensis CBS 421]CCD26392.1 hypothetical protein NDAI_0H02180 [Naumovozyma dairenensis CBS 421]
MLVYTATLSSRLKLIARNTRQLSNLLASVPQAPQDLEFQLNEEFQNDTRKRKIDLFSGIATDSSNEVILFTVIQKARQMLAKRDNNPPNDLSYLPDRVTTDLKIGIIGLIFKDSCPNYGPALLLKKRVVIEPTDGVTGALATAAKLLTLSSLSNTVWIPEPSPPNTANVFEINGFTNIKYYPYAKNGEITTKEWLETIRQGSDGSLQCILLNGCCDSASGIDPTREEWHEIIQTVYDLNMVPIIDMSYQGLKSGNPSSDALVIRTCLNASKFKEWRNGIFICHSFKYTMGLWGDDVGSLTIVLPKEVAGKTKEITARMKDIGRYLHPLPPTQSSRLVSLILSDPTLKRAWYSNLKNRVESNITMKRRLFHCLHWIDLLETEHRHNMTYTPGFSEQQLENLKRKYSIYAGIHGELQLNSFSRFRTICEAFEDVTAKNIKK